MLHYVKYKFIQNIMDVEFCSKENNIQSFQIALINPYWVANQWTQANNQLIQI